jgi:hypothetical protein
MDGNVQMNAPAGVVHEGEVVTPAAMVNAAGGPQRVQQAVESMAGGGMQMPAPQQQAAPQGGMPQGFAGGGYVAPRGRMLSGYASGGLVEQEAMPSSSMNAPVVNRTAETMPTPQESSAVQSINTPTLNRFQSTPEIPTEQLTPTGLVKPPPIEGINTPTVTRSSFTPATQTSTPPKAVLPGQTSRSLQFEKLSDDAVKNITDIAQGGSEANRKISEEATKKLSGQMAVAGMANAQAGAQIGLSNSETAASRARQQRESALAMTGLQGQLAIDAAQRSETAWSKLAELAGQGELSEENKRQFEIDAGFKREELDLNKEQFTEGKRQFDVESGFKREEIDLNKDQFAENKRQFDLDVDLRKDDSKLRWEQFENDKSEFGLEYALEKMKLDQEMSLSSVELLWKTGNYKAVGDKLKEMGFDVDVDKLVADGTQKDYGQAYANFLDDVADMSLDDTVTDANGNITDDFKSSMAYKSLQDMYKAQFGKTDYDSEEFKKYATKAVNTSLLKKDPAYPILSAFKEDEWGAMLSGITDENGTPVYNSMDDFTYGGLKGMDAFRLNMRADMISGSLKFDKDGNIVANEGSLFNQLFMGGKGLEGTDKLVTKVDAKPDGTVVKIRSAYNKEIDQPFANTEIHVEYLSLSL